MHCSKHSTLQPRSLSQPHLSPTLSSTPHLLLLLHHHPLFPSLLSPLKPLTQLPPSKNPPRMPPFSPGRIPVNPKQSRDTPFAAPRRASARIHVSRGAFVQSIYSLCGRRFFFRSCVFGGLVWVWYARFTPRRTQADTRRRAYDDATAAGRCDGFVSVHGVWEPGCVADDFGPRRDADVVVVEGGARCY
jgi:hypothetical protein